MEVICEVKCALRTCFGSFLCKTAEHGPPGEHCSMWGPFFRRLESFQVQLGMGRQRLDGEGGQEGRDCCKKYLSLWRVDPTPKSLFAIPMAENCQKVEFLKLQCSYSYLIQSSTNFVWFFSVRNLNHVTWCYTATYNLHTYWLWLL